MRNLTAARFWWYVLAIATLAWLLLVAAIATGQAPPAGGNDVIVSGFLTCSPPNGARECPFKLHYVELTRGRTYLIQMNSSDFDTSLMLEDLSGRCLARDNDDYEYLNGIIAFRPPTTGSYRLIATAAPPVNEGFYTITIRELPVVMYTEEALTPSDDMENECNQRIHEVTLMAGRRYIIDLESAAFEPFVQLLNSDGAIVAFNDECGSQRAARIVYEAPRTGVYRVVTTSATTRGLGAFTLAVSGE